ncbi:MAG TPA: helix-hairpin-helix domain-containing protein [Thermoanaerobaculia bacterium]|nr:helix-hairpin-helix domain-containing protein [Thermoanaerobaculia bacterium]
MRKSLPIFTLALIILALGTTVFADTPAAPAGVVNINTADIHQLSMLPRVGAKAAQRIVDYRTEHGPFKKTSELMQVKGFGAKTYERVAPYLSLDGKSTLAQKVKSPRKPRTKAAAQTQPANTAS